MRNIRWFYCCFLVALMACKNNKTAVPVEQSEGKMLYDKYCLICHQQNGSGVPGMYPPLQRSDWINGDKSRLIGIMLNGLTGEIKVNDQVYKTAMPSHQYLNDEQIAGVLTYIRSNFGNQAGAISPAEVTALRNSNPAPQ